MRILPLLTGLALLSTGAVLGRALPQDDAPQDTSAPGPVHEAMAARAGQYTTLAVVRAPGMDPIETPGSAKIESILGGRFLLEHGKGLMMGEPYESLKLWGYNNDTEQIEAVWVYTGGTGMMTMTGKSEDDGPIVCDASYTDANGLQEATITISFPSETSHVVRMSHGNQPDGGEVVFEETYTPVVKEGGR